jgi:hypothetical protein
MPKPAAKLTIGIDVDDVLAKSTDALRTVVNKKLKVNLLPEHYQIQDDYWGYYEAVWRQNGLADKISLADIEPMMELNQSHVLPYENTALALKTLSKNYELVVITSRPPSWRAATDRWLEEHFGNLFSKVIFTRETNTSEHKSKGRICVDNKASYFIDDNVEHAKSAHQLGIKVILFGDYGWQHTVPKHFVRCKDWQEVLEYFENEKSR